MVSIACTYVREYEKQYYLCLVKVRPHVNLITHTAITVSASMPYVNSLDQTTQLKLGIGSQQTWEALPVPGAAVAP